MEYEIIMDIHHYIQFLEGCGYSISFSFIKNRFASFTYELMRYDFHPHAVCNYLKQNPGTAGKCVCNKKRLETKGVEKAYYGCCYAGVEEYLIPVYEEDLMILCIHVSGYRGKLESSFAKMKNTAESCTKDFLKLYEELSESVPSFEEIQAFVRPLSYMILELYRHCCRQSATDSEKNKSDNLYLSALRYIHENYSQPLSSSVLAKELGYSESHLRNVFKKFGNSSLQVKIIEVRLDYAKKLLRGTAMSITEIAFAVGFTDSNYFSSVFKKYESLKPKEYRRREKRARQLL